MPGLSFLIRTHPLDDPPPFPSPSVFRCAFVNGIFPWQPIELIFSPSLNEASADSSRAPVREIMQNYYTAREAIKKLGIPRSTFYDLVKADEISKVNRPLRKRAYYPRQRIDELAEQRARMLGEVAQTPERFVFVLPQRDDLEHLVAIERMFFHESIIVPPEEQQKQLTYNPEAIHVLKVSTTITAVGRVSISPLKPDVLEQLIRLQID